MTPSQNPVYQRIVKAGRVPAPGEALGAGILAAVFAFMCMALSISSGWSNGILGLIVFAAAALVGALIGPVMLVASAMLTARHMRGEDFALLKLTGLTGAAIMDGYQVGIRRQLATLLWIGALFTPAAELGGVVVLLGALGPGSFYSLGEIGTLVIFLWLFSIGVWPAAASWLASGVGIALGSDTRHGVSIAVGAAVGLLAVELVLLALILISLRLDSRSRGFVILVGIAPALALAGMAVARRAMLRAAERAIEAPQEVTP